jgi:hypothetical protein
MNNIKAIAAILIAGTLVVAGTLAATSSTSAFAYQKKSAEDKYMKGGDNRKNKGTGNGNDYESGKTVTPQAGKQYGIVSGFDNSFNQELQNLICTHPDNNALCSTEGGQQQQPSSAACPSGQIAITGLPFTTTAVCVSLNLLASPPCNQRETVVMFLNGTLTCLGFLIT